jgi:ribose 1,5-bisphosphokinase
MPAAQLIYIMGPSGAGKDSVIQYARRKLNAAQPILFAHRYITRPVGEDIENYIALTPAEFAQRKNHGLFAFDWEAYGLSYGIGAEIRTWQSAGFTVVVDGSREHFLREVDALNDVAPILITASLDALRMRLTTRQREDMEAINRRLERAATISVSHGRLTTIDNSGPLDQAGDQLTKFLIDGAQEG